MSAVSGALRLLCSVMGLPAQCKVHGTRQFACFVEALFFVVASEAARGCGPACALGGERGVRELLERVEALFEPLAESSLRHGAHPKRFQEFLSALMP